MREGTEGRIQKINSNDQSVKLVPAGAGIQNEITGGLGVVRTAFLAVCLHSQQKSLY